MVSIFRTTTVDAYHDLYYTTVVIYYSLTDASYQSNFPYRST